MKEPKILLPLVLDQEISLDDEFVLELPEDIGLLPEDTNLYCIPID